MEQTKLTSTVTIDRYRQLKKSDDYSAIADMLYERFSERYIEPFRNHEFKHGFSMMASSCLMIESLYCFQRGLKKPGKAGTLVFEEFFSTSECLKDFTGSGESFYKNVRCGILHQGETYGGWKIRRIGPLFNRIDLVVNATKFLDALDFEIKKLSSFLKKSNADSTPWLCVIKKFDSICENCNA